MHYFIVTRKSSSEQVLGHAGYDLKWVKRAGSCNEMWGISDMCKELEKHRDQLITYVDTTTYEDLHGSQKFTAQGTTATDYVLKSKNITINDV